MHRSVLIAFQVRGIELTIIGVPIDSGHRKKRSRIRCVDRSIKLPVYIARQPWQINPNLPQSKLPMGIPPWLVNSSSTMNSHLSTTNTQSFVTPQWSIIGENIYSSITHYCNVCVLIILWII